MQRREFIKVIAGSAAAWPLATRAQQPTLPVVAFLNGGAPDASARYAAAFRRGLSETGIVEGRDVTVEYHWMEGQYERVPAVVADLVRRHVAVIAAPGFHPGLLPPKRRLRQSRLSSVLEMIQLSSVLSRVLLGPAAT
jgi:putative ABC transport system substrate-binding protein